MSEQKQTTSTTVADTDASSKKWWDCQWYGEEKTPICKMCIEYVPSDDDVYCSLHCEIVDLGMRGHLASRAPGGKQLHSRRALAKMNVIDR